MAAASGLWDAIFKRAASRGDEEDVKKALAALPANTVAELEDIAEELAKGILSRDEAMVEAQDALSRAFYGHRY